MTGEDLINTRSPAVGGIAAALEAWQAADYYNLRPYPLHAFSPSVWPEEKGPPPTALPYARILTDESSEFVFQGGPPRFSVPEDSRADAWLSEVVRANRLPSRYVALSKLLGNAGTLAAKFSVDLQDPRSPVRIAFLSCPEECRVWMDPHDQSRILMARVQYPYREADGRWSYFREEWTDASWVRYHPKPAGAASVDGARSLPGYGETLGDGDGWEIASTDDNPFGLVPVTLIKNKAMEGMPLGYGDCWGAFRLMDRLALTMHGEDRSNQQHTDPIPVTVNARLDGDGPPLPGEPISVVNNDPNKPASMMLLEPTGAAREYVYRSVDKWEGLLYEMAGVSRIDPATLTNKGNMTRLALMTAYARSVATSDGKRVLWGEAGLCHFFESLLVGVARLGGFGELSAVGDAAEVSCQWQDYFAITDDDLSNMTDRTVTQVNNNLLPQRRAVERLGTAEGIPDNEMDDLHEELEQEAEARRMSAPRADPGAAGGDALTDLAELTDASGASNFTA